MLASTYGMSIAGAAVALALLGLAAFLMLRNFDRKNKKRELEVMEAATAFGISNFHLINVDGDTVISTADLKAARALSGWNDEERRWLESIAYRFEEIGHIVSSSSKPTSILVPMGGVMMPVMGNVTTNVYAISPQDLQSYPSRLRARWKM